MSWQSQGLDNAKGSRSAPCNRKTTQTTFVIVHFLVATLKEKKKKKQVTLILILLNAICPQCYHFQHAVNGKIIDKLIYSLFPLNLRNPACTLFTLETRILDEQGASLISGAFWTVLEAVSLFLYVSLCTLLLVLFLCFFPVFVLLSFLFLSILLLFLSLPLCLHHCQSISVSLKIHLFLLPNTTKASPARELKQAGRGDPT